MLKKHQMLGLSLVAVFAFSAIIATTAFGAEFLLAEWLLSGAAITELISTTTEGKLLLEDEKVPIAGKVSVICEGVLDGSVGPNGEDEITEVLNLSGTKITLGGTELTCEKQSECEEAAKVAPIDLPWDTELQLEEPGGLFRDLVVSAAGYEVTCKVFGISSTDECKATLDSGGLVSNGASDVLLTAETILPNGTCSLGGSGAGKIQVIEGLIATLTGTLSVSE
jgi:hypothetical protein